MRNNRSAETVYELDGLTIQVPPPITKAALASRRSRKDQIIKYARADERRQTIRRHDSGLLGPELQKDSADGWQTHSDMPKFPHTNDILDFYGISDGKERTEVLTRYGRGNPTLGAPTVRDAYTIVKRLRVNEQQYGNIELARLMFLAIADSVSRYGVDNTVLLIERFGLDKLPHVIKRELAPLIMGQEFTLVPAQELSDIIAEVGPRRLSSTRWPLTMYRLGYQIVEDQGLRFYARR